MDRKFGVNALLKEIHIDSVDFVENFRKPEYKYILDIIRVENYNGNGHEIMKIYTDGELDMIRVGNWEISPIIKLPFDWRGYKVEIEMSDKNSNIFIKHGKPDSNSAPRKKDFFIDIKWIFETIKSMEYIEDCEHQELLDYINETYRLLEIYKTKSVSFKTFNELIQRLDFQQNKYKSMTDKSNSIKIKKLNIKLNESIKLFNTIMLNDSENW